MTNGELVRKVRAMREHGPVQEMTVLFGVIFHDEFAGRRGRLQEVEREYNQRYEQEPLRAGEKLNCANIRHGVMVAPHVTVNEKVLRRWR